MKIYLSKELSKKSGATYLTLYADTGFGVKQIITMDKNVIVNMLDVAPSRIDKICSQVSHPVYVADFVLNKEGNK